MTLANEIDAEVNLYVEYCQMAANHDENESLYRAIAHKIFYHIQELRSTKTLSIFGRVNR